MNTPKEESLSSVPARATQDGEANARWAWVEPTVWTSRMLAALEHGVKGGVWYSLMDKVYAPANLAAGWKRVRSNRGAAGVDHQSVAAFERHAEKYLGELHRELREGDYRPSAVRRRWIPKPGTNQQRPLGIPTVRDRIVQSALRHVLEPIWEAKFADQSYGFRPGRSCKDALRRVDELLNAGFSWVVDADIQSYYDSIDQGRMMAEVTKEVADGRVLGLVEALLQQPVMEDASQWTPQSPTQFAPLWDDARVVAVGECGLDYNRMFSPKDAQRSAFEAQIAAAAGAHGVVHCFTDGAAEAEAFLALGFDIGITGWVTDAVRGAALRDALRVIPVDRLHLETDAPYLRPKNAGKTRPYNEPALLPFVAQAVAELKGLDVAALSAQATANSRRLFKLPE